MIRTDLLVASGVAFALGVSTVMIVEAVEPRARDVIILEPDRPLPATYSDVATSPTDNHLVENSGGGEPQRAGRVSPHVKSENSTDSRVGRPSNAGLIPDSVTLGGGRHDGDDYLVSVIGVFEDAGRVDEFFRRYGAIPTIALAAWADSGVAITDAYCSEPFFPAYRRLSKMNLAMPSPLSRAHPEYATKPMPRVQSIGFRQGNALCVAGGLDLGAVGAGDDQILARLIARANGRTTPFEEVPLEKQNALLDALRQRSERQLKARNQLWELLLEAYRSRNVTDSPLAIDGYIVLDGRLYVVREGEDAVIRGLVLQRQDRARAMFEEVRACLGG